MIVLHSPLYKVCGRISQLRLVPVFIVLVAALFLGMLEAADMPDTLTLTDGEILIGKLVRSSKGSLEFHSDGAGDVTVPWAKVKDFRSSRIFAVVPKDVELKAKQAESIIPRGTIHVTDQMIQIMSVDQFVDRLLHPPVLPVELGEGRAPRP